MARVVQFLAGISVAAAASAVVTCDANVCSSCVGTALAQACANYTAPQPPVCATCGSGPTPLCSTMSASSTASCQFCAPAPTGVGSVGVCVSTTFDVAPYLTSQSSLDAGLSFALFGSSIGGGAAVGVTSVDSTSSGTVAGNAIVMLGGSSAIASLNVGSGVASNVIFQVNSSLTVTAWTNNAATAKVDNSNAAVTIGSLTTGGSKFSVFQNGSSASVTLNNIDFSSRASFGSSGGTVQIAGGTAHIGTSSSASFTGMGTLQLSGGVSVDGNIPQGVTIDVSASGKSGPVATVDAQTTLNISGDVTTSNNGVISVNGQFILGSTSAKIDPRVAVNAGATLVINSATALNAKAIDLYQSSTLVIGANANRAAVHVEKIASCLGTVQINLASTAAVFVANNGASGAVGLTYSASTNSPDQLKKCAVEVWDSAGSKFYLTSTTSASASGRRLLASDGTATWGDNNMTFQMTRTQASAAPTSFAAVPLMAATMVGLLL